jgi:lysyl-tRNA synthetase class I
MARKDEILKAFLKHEILTTKYRLNEKDLPSKIEDAKKSEIKIVKAIAMIIESQENSATDQTLRTQVMNILNKKSLL